MEEIKNLESRIETLEIEVNNTLYEFIEFWSLRKSLNELVCEENSIIRAKNYILAKRLGKLDHRPSFKRPWLYDVNES